MSFGCHFGDAFGVFLVRFEWHFWRRFWWLLKVLCFMPLQALSEGVFGALRRRFMVLRLVPFRGAFSGVFGDFSTLLQALFVVRLVSSWCHLDALLEALLMAFECAVGGVFGVVWKRFLEVFGVLRRRFIYGVAFDAFSRSF
eukprot:1012734_1